MVGSTYNFFSLFRCQTWNSLNIRLRRFLMRIISDSFLFFSIISMSNLFFWTFCKKSLRFLKIINLPHPQMSRLTCFYFYKASDIFSSIISCWISTSRKDMHCYQLDVLLCNWYIWNYVNMTHLSLFQVLVY